MCILVDFGVNFDFCRPVKIAGDLRVYSKRYRSEIRDELCVYDEKFRNRIVLNTDESKEGIFVDVV